MAFSGMEWIIVILAIVLLLFGAKKVPEIARNLGKVKAEFDRGRMMVRQELSEVDRSGSSTEEKASETKRSVEDSRSEGGEPDDRDHDSPLKKAAIDMGIDTEGRSEDELKALVRKRVTGD
jgi:sec-independent protein translocase protein TatA